MSKKNRGLLGDINLLIAGATIDDWNKIIPIINPDTI